MKDTLILLNTPAIELESGANLSALETICADWSEVAILLSHFTPTNLASVQTINERGLTVGRYNDLILQPGKWDVRDDGIHITISLREMTNIERTIKELQNGQEIQDGAITELGELIGGEA